MKTITSAMLFALFATSVASQEPGGFTASGASPWAGPYLGVTLGARQNQADWNTLTVNLIGASPTNTPSNPSSFDSNVLDGRIVLGYGLQFGSHWVAGIEADYGFAKGKKTKDGIPGTGDPVAGPPVLFRDHTEIESKQDQSLRLRLGFLATPQWLLYGTAGATRQKFTASVQCVDDSNPIAAGPWCSFTGFGPSPVIKDSYSFTRTGLTLGAGTEVVLGRGWAMRAEYRWTDFGHLKHSFLSDSTDINVVNMELKLQQQLLSAGLIYRF
jgi:outer membrane immunogenic protein